MRKRKLFEVLCIGLLAANLLMINRFPQLFLRSARAADAYGNDIKYIYVEQYNGTAWNEVNNYTATGGSDRILENQLVNFTIVTCINRTYATTNAEALSYSLVNVTISTGGSPISGWNSINCNESTTVENDTDFFYVKAYANWTSPLPVAGSTYNCTFVYWAYF